MALEKYFGLRKKGGFDTRKGSKSQRATSKYILLGEISFGRICK
tara:strand:+ start:72 stop:203 length:132 start_codon:yes stop_codon:yes gene_type:complete